MAQARTQTRERGGQATRPATTDPKAQALDLYKAQPVKTVANLLETQLHKLAAVIPTQIDPKRFGRLAIAMLNKRTELQNCTARSLLGSIAEAAALGLELDPSLGHAYLVPFKAGNQTLAQLIVGYRGFIHMLIESGRVRKVNARPVYEWDRFDMVQGTEERITHVPQPPPLDAKPDQGLMGCYSVITFTDGTTSIEWMWKREIDAIRSRSRASESGPWVTDYIPMSLKTVIRRHAKTSDASPKVTRVAAAEEARDAGLDVSLTDLSDSDLVGMRTDARTKELEQKYTGPGEQKTAQTGDAGKAVGKGTPGDGEEKPPLLPGDEGYVAPADPQGDLLKRSPGQEG